MRSIKLAVLLLFAAGLTTRAQTPAAAALPAGYVGSEICKICHEDIYNAFGKSPHHAVETSAKRGFEGRACESCHGPAQMHTESPSAANIRNPAKLAAAAADKICLTCHLNQPTHVGPAGEQSREGSGLLHLVPQSSRERAQRAGESQAGRDQ